MTLQTLAERATEAAEAQPRLIDLIQLLMEAHRDLNLTDDQHAELLELTNEAMEILRDLGR